jgi:hypothetical protein
MASLQIRDLIAGYKRWHSELSLSIETWRSRPS